jgi:hypothetical protein
MAVSSPWADKLLSGRFWEKQTLHVTAETFLEFTLSFANNQLHVGDHRLLLADRRHST